MNQDEFAKNIHKKMKVIEWLKSFSGFPDDMVPMGPCKHCNKNVVYGIQGNNGVVYNLKTESGEVNTMCGDCMIDATKQVELAEIREKSISHMDYIEKCAENGVKYGTNLKQLEANRDARNYKNKGGF